MTIFATLPVEVRRALARAELRRRNVPPTPPAPSVWCDILPFMSTPWVERLLAAWEAAEAQGGAGRAELQEQADALQNARARMLATREPAPPAPPITEWEAWNDHQELYRFAGTATEPHLATVDRLLAETSALLIT